MIFGVSKTSKEHIEQLQVVFDVLSKNKLYAKLGKCHFAKNGLEYLGHMVGKDGIKVDSRKIEIVAKWTRPKDVNKLHSFFVS